MSSIRRVEFAEFRGALEASPSLVGSVRDRGLSDEEQIVEYLAAGVSLAVSAGRLVDDVIDGTQGIARAAVLTDGLWTWRADLAYYVQRYHVMLPDDFVTNIRSRSYKVPELTEADLLAIERAHFGE